MGEMVFSYRTYVRNVMHNVTMGYEKNVVFTTTADVVVSLPNGYVIEQEEIKDDD